MKRKRTFEIVQIAGDYLLIPTEDRASFGGTVVLNEVAAYLLRAMDTDISQEQLLERMLDTYAVERDTAARDLDRIVQTFQTMGLIEQTDRDEIR